MLEHCSDLVRIKEKGEDEEVKREGGKGGRGLKGGEKKNTCLNLHGTFNMHGNITYFSSPECALAQPTK